MRTNTQRILTLAGMTLATGAVLGMGATAASAATSQDSQATVAQPGPHDNGGDNGGGHNNGGGNGWGNGGGGHNNGGGGNGWGNGHNNGGGNWWGNGHGNGGRDHVWTVGRFPTKKSCDWAGWVGEHNGSWDDAVCVPVGRGYLLIVRDNGHRHHR